LPRPKAADLPGLPAVVQRSQACLRQGEAYLLGTSADRLFLGRGATPAEQEFQRGLQEKLEEIQAMLAELTGPNPTAPVVAAAQAVCDAVDALIGGREWSL
ncbi:MAG TPA: hypothetical protein VJP78_04625, partial [Thermoleophilia bacterium]|nr:hypothetical protein [Thermoleophilia bacterium]